MLDAAHQNATYSSAVSDASAPAYFMFLQRVGIAESYSSAVYAMIGSVCPSVRPSSVTFRCFVETNEATIMRFLPTGRTFILVSEEVKIVWKFARDHP